MKYKYMMKIVNDIPTEVHIDGVLDTFDNFLGYQGNSPTNAEEFANLKPIQEDGSVWKDNNSPTWDEVLAKQTEMNNECEGVIGVNPKDLKASAKSKLIAGETLTQAEADTIVL